MHRDVSFSQQLIVRNTDIRGYTQGAYRGDYLLALQGEYRWNFHRRWGAVGFAGVATLFEGINDSDNGKLFNGKKVTLNKQNKINKGTRILWIYRD